MKLDYEGRFIGRQIELNNKLKSKKKIINFEVLSDIYSTYLSFFKTKQDLKFDYKLKTAKSLYKFLFIENLIQKVNLDNYEIKFKPRNLFNKKYCSSLGGRKMD